MIHIALCFLPFAFLELETSLAGAVSQGFYTTMVQVTAAVKNNVFDTGSLCPFSDQFAHCDRLFLFRSGQSGRRGRSQRMPCQVVDYLAVNGFVGAKNAQTWTRGRSVHFFTDAHMNALTTLLFCAFHYFYQFGFSRLPTGET
jgi:hypothetical protein